MWRRHRDVAPFDACARRAYHAWRRAWPRLSEQAVSMGQFDGLSGVLWTALDTARVEPTVDLLGLQTKWN